MFSGLRLRLLLMVLLVCAPLLAWMLYSAGQDRRRDMAAWESRITTLTQIARKEEKEVFDSTRQLLFATSLNAAVQRLDPEEARTALRDIWNHYPRFANLGLLSTNGDVLTSVFPPAETNVSKHTFFTKVRDRQEYTMSGLIGIGSNSRICFAQPVRSPEGRLIGIVYADLNVGSFSRVSEIPGNLPPDSTWTEIDRLGKVVAYYGPSAGIMHARAGVKYFQPEVLGRKLSDPWLMTNALADGRGILEGRDLKGVQKIYALHMRNRPSGWVVGIMATPRAALFAEADQELARNLKALSIAGLVALVFGLIGSKFLVLRPVKALVRSTARLAAGDLSVRTGLKPSHDELGQLTYAFDQMAQALETRELEHKRASHKLQVLSQRLVEVQEAERRHIARELHDEIGQSLTAAEMNLQAALQSPRASSLQRRLEDSVKAVERVLEQVHDLSLNLRPSMLDDLGLEPALRWYTHRQADLTGMRAEFRAEPLEERLDPLIETECFRVAQEALTNVVRHAQASVVQVELSRSNNHIHLCVRDDGVGFDVGALRTEAVQGASLGLLSMEERTSLAGGGLEFTSSPGAGTEVHAWFPLLYRNREATAEFNEQYK